MESDFVRQFTIGRSVSSDIRVADRSVSRNHAVLRVGRSGDLRLYDRRSRNGTFVRTDRGGWDSVQEKHVEFSTRVRLGAYQTTIENLISQLPSDISAIVMTGRSEIASDIDAQRLRRGSQVLVVGGKARKHLKQPRRNAATGLIEEKE